MLEAGERLGDAEALALLEHGDLLTLGARADAVRRRLHPGDEATFIVDRNINYTDYCVSGCRFCAFYKKPGSGEGYLLAEDDIHRKIDETLALGRHGDHDAGRSASRAGHLLVREGLQRDQGALPDPHPLAVAARDRAHRDAQRPHRRGDPDAPPCRGPRLAARRRRRGACRPSAPRDQPPQDPHRHSGST